MKVTGFTIVRNAEKYDYPVVEAIASVLPVCDNFIVLAGDSDDRTNDLLNSIQDPKLSIKHIIWDNTLRNGGAVLAAETNKAMAEIPFDSDWAFYIQADEIVHEKYYNEIKYKMEFWKDKPEVEGLLFGYRHFYGTYDYIGNTTNWYRNEVRIIRPNSNIISWGDAQGFRKADGQKIKVKQIDAKIFHYGWVKHPATQQKKIENFSQLWQESYQKKESEPEFDYSNISSLEKFQGSHPSVMTSRIEEKNWTFVFDKRKIKTGTVEKIRSFIERKTGWRIGEYKNYKII
ncbi:MAG: glycosyltransferase family 2 protein [Candidatus Kapabacteria bacterium]|nr:glycosyltransferase family 2 protein [Candidatus Kapabacteria bacterium]